MKELTIEIQGKKVIKEELESLEKELKLCFPDEYKEVLLKYGGCRVKEYNYNDKASISFFLTLTSKRNTTVKNIIDVYKEDYGEVLWLPFATDPGGWVFVFSLNNYTYGQIFLDRFDCGEEFPFEYLSPSFEDFISSLKPLEE